MDTAIIYAYKTKNAEAFGLDPNKVYLAYQVSRELAPCQVDCGKEMMALELREFMARGGLLRVAQSSSDLVLPLKECKVQVPVSPRLLRDWELSDLLK